MIIPSITLNPTTTNEINEFQQTWLTTYAKSSPFVVVKLVNSSNDSSKINWEQLARLTRSKIRIGPITTLEDAGLALNAGCLEILVQGGNDEFITNLISSFPGIEHRICIMLQQQLTDNSSSTTTTYPTEDQLLKRISDLKQLSGISKFQIELLPSSTAAAAATTTTTKYLNFAQLLTNTQALKKTYFTLQFNGTTETEQQQQQQPTMLLPIENSIGEIHRLSKDYPIHMSIPMSHLPLESSQDMTQLSMGRILSKCAVEPKDGLFPTVVTDTSGIALGFVYSNVDSLCVSTAIGRGVYWSRSRNELWRKGDTSGAIQELIDIHLDCDSDCFRFMVNQKGNPPAFCHRNVRTCWGEDTGIANLFRVLESRKISAPVGSYTAKLYKDADFLRDKLLEEAQELAEAVKEVSLLSVNNNNNSSSVTTTTTTTTNLIEHVNQETADVLYFALAGCVAGGGSLLRVEEILDSRALKIKRRTGETKTERIRTADERLNEIKKVKMDG
jgi:phosphoribosyl-AMP cyclohydrolase/phosphoribosyl-ATP pyrophosphohydrolase